MSDFQEIYQRYVQDVYRFSLYLSGDHALAEDISSEVFVRLWTSTEPIRMQTVKGYLFAIARRLYIDDLRAARRRRHLTPEISAAAGDPETLAAHQSELQWVLKRLQEFPEIDRTALLMRAQQELSYEEIALALGLSIAAVKVKVHRARLKLAAAKAEMNAAAHSEGGVR
jgi:RNA polymerase sigma-70 factor (ECF subfamily)